MEAPLIESIPFNLYVAAAPLFVLAIGGLITVLFPSFGGRIQTPLYVFSLLTLGAAIAALVAFPITETFWGGAFVSDALSWFGQALILLTALVLVMLYKDSCLADRFFTREAVSLFLLATLGMMVMVASTDLVTLFVGLELSSIGIYVLVGYVFPNRASLEGAMKYLVLGSFASAFLLFGFGFLYASSGTMNLVELARQGALAGTVWMKIGILFTLVGLGFKLALVPFHMWTPDAYEAAPTGITALMATAVKAMILVLVLRMTQGLSIYSEQWYPILIALSFLSMIGGNFFALVQTSVKRMLAYSSIAHSGYMAIVLCALAGGSELPYQALLFYVVAYTLTSLLAFGTLMWLEDKNRQNLQLNDLRGLVKSHPWAALALSAAMFSFAGMPPTVGFFAKFFVFNAALREKLYFLVFAGIAGSIISLYYYLRVIVTMYMQKQVSSEATLSPRSSLVTALVLSTTFLAILLLGTVLPEQVLEQLKPIALSLRSH